MDNNLVWTFAERCEVIETVPALFALFTREIRALGFSNVACCSHVDPLAPPRDAVIMIDYPRDWLAHFSEAGYAQSDPVFNAAQRQMLPFRWRDPRFRAGLQPSQIQILDEAEEVGLGDGLTIPLHAPGALPASCSLVVGPDGVDPLNIRLAHWLAVYAHEAARRILQVAHGSLRPRLSPRERQVLELVGRGKDDYAIGVLLGIQQSTAHNTVQRAMNKYGVATRVQAVIRALRENEIMLQDLA